MKLLKKIKGILKGKDQKAIETAEEEFDQLMQRVDSDEMDLTNFEGHMRAEWDEMHKQVDSDSKKVDEVVAGRKKA